VDPNRYLFGLLGDVSLDGIMEKPFFFLSLPWMGRIMGFFFTPLDGE